MILFSYFSVDLRIASKFRQSVLPCNNNYTFSEINKGSRVYSQLWRRGRRGRKRESVRCAISGGFALFAPKLRIDARTFFISD